jgi:hypothetical protein
MSETNKKQMTYYNSFSFKIIIDVRLRSELSKQTSNFGKHWEQTKVIF